MQTTPQLSHAEAMQVISFIQKELETQGAGAAAAVVDTHGELIAFLRADGCPLASINNAIHKAFTSAREGVESGAVGQRSREEGWPMTNFGDLTYTGWGGGVPLIYKDQVVGAVGISGLPEADDVDLARRAAKIISEKQ